MRVLTDNGLTAAHGFVGMVGLIEPNETDAEGLERLKPRREMFAALGARKARVTFVTMARESR